MIQFRGGGGDDDNENDDGNDDGCGDDDVSNIYDVFLCRLITEWTMIMIMSLRCTPT